MKAVVFEEFGGSDVLQVQELPDPEPGPGEVAVDILASALNHLDVDVREGVSRFPVEPPFVLGVEVVGRITALGEGVTGWEVGERVMPYLMATCGECVYCRTGRESLCPSAGFISFSTSGGYAEKLACSVRHLIRIPDSLSDEAAAATQIAFGTAWHMLFTRGRLAPAERVMINSVGSGIGSAAVQLAFRVPPPAVDACHAELVAKGVPIVRGPTDLPDWRHRALFFRDPEANVIEIYAEY